VRALIVGVLGQDGRYLAEQLAADGHDVYGMTRRPHRPIPGVRLHHGDLLDQASVEAVLYALRPDEVYNLAAVTAPGCGWGCPQPPLLADVTALGVVKLLDAMVAVVPDAKLVHASSSAIYQPHRYGLYGVAKTFAHETVVGYRSRLHTSNAVFYSHTSPRQDPRFLAPTICSTLARIAAGSQEKLVLTDLVGLRDWGWAPDFTRALPIIARAEPGDYVVATGQQHTVREFVNVALQAAGLTWAEAVNYQPGPPTPAEPPADNTALRAFGWKPETRFEDMVRLMVNVLT
jgi:GDPmannose 4,6-dehydratase